MSTTSSEPQTLLVTAKEAARLLGICERSLWQRKEDGLIRCVKIGNSVRHSRNELERFIESQMN